MGFTFYPQLRISMAQLSGAKRHSERPEGAHTVSILSMDGLEMLLNFDKEELRQQTASSIR